MHARNPRRAVVASLLFVGLSFFLVPSAAAQTVAVTDIQTTVCGADSKPLITIDTPLSDTTVSSNSIALEGNIQRASTIVVTVDGTYDQTVSLASSSTRYHIDVQVVAGTRTIRLEAIGLCGDSATAGVIVSVAPESQGSPNALVETLEPNLIVKPEDVQSKNEPFESMGQKDVGVAAERPTSSLAKIIRQLAAPLLFIASAGTIVYAISAGAIMQQTSSSLIVYHRKTMIVGVVGACLALLLGS